MDTPRITTVKLKMNTKSLLDKLKVIERESYDEVIQRLIQHFSKEQPELNSKTKKIVPEMTQKVKEEEIVPEMTQSVKEEKNKLLQNILGSIKNNKKEAVKKSGKKKEIVSSHFKY